ncbi:PAS domain-containing protein [Lysinibacillus halotolerans]|uniref:histidine kinase n=2 Tax=Bacilli TaxID=91061 RepID=A0A3M8H7M1_9BACI|nr:PAS domain-containing protein [Lysinibacillus halotolerans]
MEGIGVCKMVKTVRPIFRKLFKTVNDPVLILNTSCQIESINDFAAQLLNIDPASRQELQLDELSKARWNDFVSKIQNELGGFCNLNVKIGENRYKEIRLIGYFHKEKNLVFARIALMTEKRSLLNQKSNLDIYSMFNDISHGIILSDKNGYILDANDMALEYFQCGKNHLINKQHEMIFEKLEDYEYSKLQYFANLLNTGRASVHVSGMNKHGEEIFLKLDSKFNYKMNMIVTTMTDETEIMLLKQQVEQQETLDSIGQMAASIAHEIRNPLTSLKGFLELIKINSSGDNLNYLNVMDSELQRMDEILNEILYLSKPKQVHYEEISVFQIVQDVVELMIPFALQNNIMLKIDSYNYYHLNIKGNHTRLKQMLINLVKNAIEVMVEGGTITIKLETNNDEIDVLVIDEGPGLTDREIDQLFTPFYTTKPTGTGLGLPLVKKVIEEHHGSINIESSVGVGTTFKISLPICDKKVICTEKEKLIDVWIKKESLDRLPVV